MSERHGHDRSAKEPKGEDQSRMPRLIVGIGASAGELEAFQTFLKNMPPDSGIAFVFVQHLLPSRPSMLAELLARHTAMPVQEGKDGLPVERDRVYVIPPNASLTVEHGRLRVIVPLMREGHHTVIDRFFASLAEDQGSNAVCIILSGAGHEGTLGVKAVKEHGGLTMAQNVETAAHASMPGSAAAAGFVDLVLDVDKMPRALLDYANNLIRLNHRNGSRPIEASLGDHLGRIYELLREQQGHDFSKYKPNTFARRVQRRMQVLQLADVGAYVERLEGDGSELNQLFRDLLIGVTRFFRDPAAFEALAREVIAALVEDKSADERIRVWVPGCGSGEEAYSIGILLLEELQKREHPPQAQIFATDINETALTSARSGLYPAAALADVPRERVERFFVRENGLYRVAKSLRAMCLFALQSVIADPPFSRLDLISCRNVLIYLGPDLQARLLPLFHYALREDGFLFLGSAETVGRHSRLFSPVDNKHRIFRRRIARLTTRPTFPADALTRRTRELRQPPEVRAEPSPAQWAEALVLQHYAPAYLVIDEHFDVIQFSARTLAVSRSGRRQRDPERVQPDPPGAAHGPARGLAEGEEGPRVGHAGSDPSSSGRPAPLGRSRRRAARDPQRGVPALSGRPEGTPGGDREQPGFGLDLDQGGGERRAARIRARRHPGASADQHRAARDLERGAFLLERGACSRPTRSSSRATRSSRPRRRSCSR